MKKSIQIDVKGPLQDSELMLCFMYFKGDSYRFYMPKDNYEELIKNGLFIRNGKTKDGANVINTTAVYKIDKP